MNINELLNEMEAMRYSDCCIALQIVYWNLTWSRCVPSRHPGQNLSAHRLRAVVAARVC